MKPYYVCHKCGAHLQRPFQVGELIFGSECVTKLTTQDFTDMGASADLSLALQSWLNTRRNKKEETSVDINAMPAVGAVGYLESSAQRYTVTGYTGRGLKLRGVWKGITIVLDLPFNRAGEWNAENKY